jgi:ethanolamine transporter EutH
MKKVLTVLAVSTASVIGALFMLTLNLSTEAILACIIGTLAAVILLFVAFLTFENNKKDNETF